MHKCAVSLDPHMASPPAGSGARLRHVARLHSAAGHPARKSGLQEARGRFLGTGSRVRTIGHSTGRHHRFSVCHQVSNE